jgi:hypothetical protein
MRFAEKLNGFVLMFKNYMFFLETINLHNFVIVNQKSLLRIFVNQVKTRNNVSDTYV